LDKLYNWAGRLTGFLDGGYFYNKAGINVGKLIENEMFSPEGTYLGEIAENGRLITKKSKKNRKKNSFSQKRPKSPINGFIGYGSLVMWAGYEEFPDL
jgi:hypothetical protein